MDNQYNAIREAFSIALSGRCKTLSHDITEYEYERDKIIAFGEYDYIIREAYNFYICDNSGCCVVDVYEAQDLNVDNYTHVITTQTGGRQVAVAMTNSPSVAKDIVSALRHWKVSNAVDMWQYSELTDEDLRHYLNDCENAMSAYEIHEIEEIERIEC